MKLNAKMKSGISVLIFTLFFVFTHASYIRKRQSDECQTAGCLKAAASLRENMDETADPCNDFYRFACGGYIDKRTIPEDKSIISVFQDTKDGLNQEIRNLLEKPLTGSEQKFIKMVKDMYDSCMNTNNIEQAGSEPLKKVLASLGGWPVVEEGNWDASKFDWMETTFKLRKLGYDRNFIIYFNVILDLKNSTEHIIAIDQGHTGVSNRYVLKGLSEPVTAAYYNLMVKAAVKLGASKETAEKEMTDVFNFETTIAKNSVPLEQRRDFNSFYNKYSVQGLQELTPQIDWLKYINGLLDGDESVTADDKLLVIAPPYIRKVGEMIANTDKRILANYILWRVVKESIPMLSKDWSDLASENKKANTGTNQEEPRLEKCLDLINENLMIALNSYYVRNYFDHESKEKASEMITYLRREFLSMLNKADWMEESTKAKAIEKANVMTSYVGYVQELLDDAKISQYYQGLNVLPNDYFNNILQVQKWDTSKNYFSKLRQLNIKGDWTSHADAAVVNAYYNRYENSIDIPAGVLQKSFFSKDRPYYMNFGAIGFVLGHEITHGFDDTGRQFDKNGNVQNWWDDATNQRYKTKAQCLIDQYSEYTAENGMKLNGIKTLAENTADNGGIKESYYAYQSWVKDNGPEQKLPGMKYTPGQLYFISAANIYCSKYRPEALKSYIASNPHSPFPFRVLGPMSNFDKFAEEFQCAPGTTMNPQQKCQVW